MTVGERSAQLISETLDSVVTRSTRNAILARALRAGGLVRVPSEPDELRRFVNGPLAVTLANGLGADLAASILQEIALVTQVRPPSTKPERRPSRVPPKRSTSPPPRRNTPTHRISAQRRPVAQPLPPPTSRPPPSSERGPTSAPATVVPPRTSPFPAAASGLTPPPLSGPVARGGVSFGSNEYPMGASSFGVDAGAPIACVLVVSLDGGLVERLTPWLDGRAELLQVGTVRELVRDLEALEDRGRIVLLIDCRRPSIRPTAIAALADELLPAASVVLWGPTADQEKAVRAVSPDVSRWVVVQSDARPKELAARCVKAIG